MKKENRGFIALISVLIISAILLTLMVTVGFSGWFARADVLTSEQYRDAQMESQGCIDIALRIIATAADPSTYTVHNQNVILNSNHACTIVSIVHEGNKIIIITMAKEGNAISHRKSYVTLTLHMQILNTAAF
ncbi:MAG: hypothetical protein JWO50_711 [Candidatus Kaiserbacteria bacterium]|nr:hypothetical protein [Candidatus Kaiserbacteria bacterium]